MGDLRKDYTDKISRKMGKVGDHLIDPINHTQPTLDDILTRFIADFEDELDTMKRPNELLLIKDKALQSLADYIQREVVVAVRNEIRHLVEGDEDGVVYSLEAIGRRAEERHKQLSTIKVPLVVGDSPVTPGEGRDK